MKRLSHREWLSVVLLSIIIPVGSLTTFRLTGILQGPTTVSETTTLEAVRWEFQRPGHYTYIDDWLGDEYVEDGLSARFRMVFGIYEENSSVRYGADYITLGINISSTTTKPGVSIESVCVVFHRDSQSSLVDWINTYFIFQNLSLQDVSSGRTTQENYNEAYVRLTGLSHPEGICFWATAEWSLITPNTQTHQMEVTYELIYYNGTAYKKIVQLFQLNVTGR